MAALPAQRRTVATFGALAALLVGAATLQAAIGGETGLAAPRVQVSAAGSMSISDSKPGAAIFALANIGPGDGGQGEVTISNSGALPGTLSLVSLDRSDAPGIYGGALSQRLELQLEEVSSGTPAELYTGQLAAMPELQLGPLAAGESRTYRFVVSMLDGGPPASPYVDDNVYQRASASLGYQWTLTEVEAGASEPEPPRVPPAPTPVEPSPPVEGPLPTPEPVGTPHADKLIGTSGEDIIYGRGGSDRIYGKGGRDYLVGGAGADWLYGGAGADRLRGGAGSDHLFGGAGPDLIFARGGGADFINCGSGRDIAYVDKHDRIKGCERVHGQ